MTERIKPEDSVEIQGNGKHPQEMVPQNGSLNTETNGSSKGTYNLFEKHKQFLNKENKLHWKGNLVDYSEMVVKNPEIVSLSHKRIYDMIMSAGVQTKPDGTTSYNFFNNEIFGLEDSVQQLVEYFNAASKKLEVRKRILLLMGPVGGGKSTLVTLLKRGLENYTRTDQGALYEIDGCPMHEEPLHALPESIRPELKQKFGIHIEGDLCPKCTHDLDKKYGGKAENIPVKRAVFSEKERVGIGTFSPSDPKSQDVSELTGSIDLSTIGDYGAESDPRAYRFDGELNVANRGMVEFVEMLKSDEKFLYGLLTLSQEQNIKTGRFAMIYADEVVISHTNESEFDAFIGNKKSEALQDRIIVVKVPYNLISSEEEKIYRKLISQSNVNLGKNKENGEKHIDPMTLKLAADFAVLSRLEPSKKAGMKPLKKMKLYNGEEVEGFNQQDVSELKAEAVREGMDGISPRYIINRLSNELARDEKTCLTPIDAIRSFRDGFDQNTGISGEEKERLNGLLGEVRKEYDDQAKKKVFKAFIYNYEEQAKNLWNNYLDNVEAYCMKRKIQDPLTDEVTEPDEKLMRSIEEKIGVSDAAKKAHRDEVLIRISSQARKGQSFDYTTDGKMGMAIEAKLFADVKDLVKITTSSKTPDPKQAERMNTVMEILVQENGYCDHCAGQLLDYVGKLVNR